MQYVFIPLGALGNEEREGRGEDGSVGIQKGLHWLGFTFVTYPRGVTFKAW